MKGSRYRVRTILRVLLCSQRDLRADLARTMIGRDGIEVFRVSKLQDARLVASSLGVQVILVDGEMPDALGFVSRLRRESATRNRSIGVLTRSSAEQQFLGAGANAVFRLPPGSDWDERFSKLLSVPVRQQARTAAHIRALTDREHAATILNLSPSGMLLATKHELDVGDEITFRFALPDLSEVRGSGRVARIAGTAGFGVQFLKLEDDGEERIADHLRSARLESDD